MGYIFFYLKCVRYKEGYDNFTRRAIMSLVKTRHMAYIEKLIKENPECANQRDKDLNYNDFVRNISFLASAFELIHLLFFVSFHFGMIYFVITSAALDSQNEGTACSSYWQLY